jgi:hypothetical protein
MVPESNLKQARNATMKKPKNGPRLVTDAQREARKANIVAFNQSGEAGALKHGAQSAAVRTGVVPDADLQRLIDEFHAGWIADLGGLENITSARRAILFAAKGSLACFAMGLRHLERHGLVDDKGKVAPIANILATFGNSMRLHLTAAGLDRKARDCKTLEMRLAELAEAEQAESVSDSEKSDHET